MSRKMKILVACEESQAVTIELRRLGHEAYSCDIEPCSGGHPEWHIQRDVLEILNDEGWDMVIAFPPCTHLACSGAMWFAEKRADGRQQQGIDFFMQFANCRCPKVAIENPIGIMSKQYRKPDQIIHPWQFGDKVNKSTCLWLKGLPKLVPEITEKPEIEYFEWKDKKTGRTKRQEIWYYNTRHLPPDQRGKIASKTFPGIARAMAEQWAGPVDEVREVDEIETKREKTITSEEAEKIIGCLGWGYPEDEIAQAVAMAQQALRENGRPDERETPVSVKADKVWNTFKCPNCRQTYGDDEHDVRTLRYCPHCGKPLNWEADK